MKRLKMRVVQIREWKMDPGHRLAQAMGRDKWYQFVTVCPANYRKTENPVNQWKL